MKINLMLIILLLITNRSYSCIWSDYNCIDGLFDKKIDELESVYKNAYDISYKGDSLFAKSKDIVISCLYNWKGIRKIEYKLNKRDYSLSSLLSDLENEGVERENKEYLYNNNLFIEIDSNENQYTILYSSFRNDELKYKSNRINDIERSNSNNNQEDFRKEEVSFLLGIGAALYDDLDMLRPSLQVGLIKSFKNSVGYGASIGIQGGSKTEDDVTIDIINTTVLIGPVFAINDNSNHFITSGISIVLIGVESWMKSGSDEYMKPAFGYAYCGELFGVSTDYVIDVGLSIKALLKI